MADAYFTHEHEEAEQTFRACSWGMKQKNHESAVLVANGIQHLLRLFKGVKYAYVFDGEDIWTECIQLPKDKAERWETFMSYIERDLILLGTKRYICEDGYMTNSLKKAVRHMSKVNGEGWKCLDTVTRETFSVYTQKEGVRF